MSLALAVVLFTWPVVGFAAEMPGAAGENEQGRRKASAPPSNPALHRSPRRRAKPGGALARCLLP
jgi:hypothetical protein